MLLKYLSADVVVGYLNPTLQTVQLIAWYTPDFASFQFFKSRGRESLGV